MPKIKRADWFPFYPVDFLHGVVMMPPEGRGIYVTLLATQWLNFPALGIENDEKYLMHICNYQSAKKWRKDWQTVSHKFFIEDGRLYNKRLLTERDETMSKIDAAKESASSRWGASPTAPASVYANGYANASPNASANGNANAMLLHDMTEHDMTEHDVHDVVAPPPKISGEIGYYESGQYSGIRTPEKLAEKFRDIWQGVRGLSAICKMPSGKGKDWFKEHFRGSGPDLLIPAFELWCDEKGKFSNTDSPIFEFLKDNLQDWLAKVLPLNRPEGEKPLDSIAQVNAEFAEIDAERRREIDLKYGTKSQPVNLFEVF